MEVEDALEISGTLYGFGYEDILYKVFYYVNERNLDC